MQDTASDTPIETAVAGTIIQIICRCRTNPAWTIEIIQHYYERMGSPQVLEPQFQVTS